MNRSSRSRAAAAVAGALCIGALSAQFAVAQATREPAVLHAGPSVATDRVAKPTPGGVVLHTEDPRVAARAIAAMHSQDPSTYRIDWTDSNGRRTVLGSLGPDVLERGTAKVYAPSASRNIGRGRTIIIFIYIRSSANAAAYDRLNTALRGADASSYTLTEVH